MTSKLETLQRRIQRYDEALHQNQQWSARLLAERQRVLWEIQDVIAEHRQSIIVQYCKGLNQPPEVNIIELVRHHDVRLCHSSTGAPCMFDWWDTYTKRYAPEYAALLSFHFQRVVMVGGEVYEFQWAHCEGCVLCTPPISFEDDLETPLWTQ